MKKAAAVKKAVSQKKQPRNETLALAHYQIDDYVLKASNPEAKQNILSILAAFNGNILAPLQTVELTLPKELVKWANHVAFNLGDSLSDLVRELLEYERYRVERFHTTIESVRRSREK